MKDKEVGKKKRKSGINFKIKRVANEAEIPFFL